MKSQLANVPIEEIEFLYQQAIQNLHKQLLDGASWKELRAQRALVTELSVIIDSRKRIKKLPIENHEKANHTEKL